MSVPQDPESRRAGLCGSCAQARRVESARGSVFLMCELSKTNPRFARYPALPVLRCSGYEAAGSQPAIPPTKSTTPFLPARASRLQAIEDRYPLAQWTTSRPPRGTSSRRR